MMNPVDLIARLDDAAAKQEKPSECVASLIRFVESNENSFTFKFENALQLSKLIELLHLYLTESWPVASSTHSNMIVACMNTIRLLARDQSLSQLYENEPLLGLVQRVASLSIVNETDVLSGSVATASNGSNVSTSDLDMVTLSALKSMSNLIYNSKSVQEFYIRNGVAETITISIKQFNPADAFQGNALASSKINIMLFNLRILFLLTALNKELRMKLREKLQVITYLIEIIDQIMKERLNEDSSRTSNTSSVEASGQLDFCYLKSIDIDFINEILKILYNLTIDLTNSANTTNISPVAYPGSSQAAIPSSSASFNVRTANSEEDEAHLMHLVSVLRDLITCRLEEEFDSAKSTSKLKMLHSNIINLLTNMPNLCYEELMTPSISNNGASPSQAISSPVNKLFKQISNFDARMAHNIKRLSRRSKRIKNKQSDSNKEQSASLSVNTGSSNKIKNSEASEYNSLQLINSEEDLEFESKNVEALIIILEYLHYHINSYLTAPSDLSSDLLYPILLLLSLMAKSNRTIRHYYKQKILPPLRKKDLVMFPERGFHLRNKLVRLMTDPNLQIKRLSAQFLFVLCKENVNRLIKYTGYGNAAGLLADAGLLMFAGNPGDHDDAYSSDSQDSDSEDYKRYEETINQVTGRAEIDDPKLVQYDRNADKYYKLKKDLFENMTEEQKEYEAIQLVNAIDKLTRISGGAIRPAAIGPDGRPIELQHVLQLQQQSPDQPAIVTNEALKNLKNGKKQEEADEAD